MWLASSGDEWSLGASSPGWSYMNAEVLFVHPGASSFVERDLDVIREAHSVRTFEYGRRRDLFKLMTLAPRCRIGIAWFVLGYALPLVLICERLGIPTLLIAGGYDVEACPEIGYGAMLAEQRRRRTISALERASRVLAVSEFTKRKVLGCASTANVEVLYHGFPLAVRPDLGPREDRVVSVANVARHTWKLKGLPTLLQVASAMPNVSFVVVGGVHAESQDYLRNAPPNVRFLGWADQSTLYRLCWTSKVYAQLSYVESFGCALAEAMSCGCYPVVTNRGALPEVVGETGSLVEYGDVEGTIRAIRNGLAEGGSHGAEIRIRHQFPLEDRKSRLLQIVHDLLADSEADK